MGKARQQNIGQWTMADSSESPIEDDNASYIYSSHDVKQLAICIYIYIYIYTHTDLPLSLSLYTYIYIYL